MAIPGRMSAARPAGVNVVGYLRAETGMGEGARALARALRHRGCPLADVSLPDRAARQADFSLRGTGDGARYPVSIIFSNPDQSDAVHAALGPAFFAGRYTIGVWLWELESLPPSLRRFEHLDEIWACSRFVQAAVARTAPVPVVCMPLPVSPPRGPATPCRLVPADGRVTFLFVFDALSVVARKNPFAVVEAFRRAFGATSREARLVIKATRIDRFPDEHRTLRDTVAAVGGTLIDTYVDRPALASLFEACDAYVSLHRSEGFGLTMAEAMALGKPVIATAYSGNMDFMRPDNSFPVKYRLVRLDRSFGPYPEGAVWADPDIDHAAGHMRFVVERREEALARGRRGQDALAATHGYDTVGRLIAARLDVIQRVRRHRAA